MHYCDKECGTLNSNAEALIVAGVAPHCLTLLNSSLCKGDGKQLGLELGKSLLGFPLGAVISGFKLAYELPAIFRRLAKPRLGIFTRVSSYDRRGNLHK